MYEDLNFTKTLIGKTLENIERVGDEELIFVVSDTEKYKLYHYQNCCESVTIEDICGDLDDLLENPLLLAELVTSNTKPEDVKEPEYEPESQTWSFYKLSTIKGSVTIRWFGQSNGYYSETVTLERLES